MHILSKISLALAITLTASVGLQAKAPAQAGDRIPTYRVSVVNRTARAVKYNHRSGATKIDFQGTDLMPSARGQASVNSRRGTMTIEVEFSDLDKPTAFGNEYLTYVMWAISPEGRAVNIGEVLVGGNHRSKLEVTTDLQAFAMIVTAEPYYAVRRPSNVVVMENVIRPDTEGTAEVVDAKYELIERGGYIPTGFNFDPIVLNAKLPLEFFEARNAVRIAKSEGAEEYAAPSYANAVRQMNEADGIAIGKHQSTKSLISISRETVQTAEDAREIAVKHIESVRADYERNRSAKGEADAKAQSDRDAQGRANAESMTAEAVRQRDEADRKNKDAQAAATTSDLAAQQATRDRDEADRKNRDAQADALKAKGAQADAEADADRNRAKAALSDQQAQAAIHDREELRAKLLQQFNLILETRDTARGLVVNMSDVLFDSGKYTLRPLAREKLAKISGILLAYPMLNLAVEGNTDSVGTEAYNQDLSEKRAGGVRDYLTAQGVPAASTTSAGFGKDRPVASNDTADGRQQNRRVELVVSGEVIGTKIVSIKVVQVAGLPLPKPQQ